MEEALKMDESLRSIADLPPGWSAWRESKDSPWQKEPEVRQRSNKETE